MTNPKPLNHKFYITTTLPYVNASPHIGFALEITAADAIARYQRQLGRDVVFNTGTDEHGQKIYEQALASGKDPQAYCDEYAQKFASLKESLNLSFSHFIRTTDPHHIAAAREFWQRCQQNGDIYKRDYQVSYCVGCELEKQASELVDGHCPLHPTQELEIREEENYFFRFSKYDQELLNLYENHPEFVKPEGKLKEIRSFVAGGLNDFSISRLKSKMPWGISVPGDDEHVMYVWFDALVNYISTLGWPEDEDNFNDFWPGMQVAGKDNLRQQSAMWQAMLISAGLPPSSQILINGFINVGGQKMSKSLGNVITPEDMVKKYGVDGTRYLLLDLGPFGEDMDVTWEKLDQVYTANLANGLGNLCSRVAKLCQKYEISGENVAADKAADKFAAYIQINDETGQQHTLPTNFHQKMSEFEIAAAIDLIFKDEAGTELGDDSENPGKTFKSVSELDKHMSKTKPWLQPEAEAKENLRFLTSQIILIALHLQPFMPETAEKILNHFSNPKISALEPLFPRI